MTKQGHVKNLVLNLELGRSLWFKTGHAVMNDNQFLNPFIGRVFDAFVSVVSVFGTKSCVN